MSFTTSLRSRFSIVCGMIALCLCAGFSSRANAELSPSLKLMPILSFNGLLDSVNVPVGDGFIPTGPISIALDPTATNVFGLDDLEEAGYIDVTLILSSELLSILGETPKIRIIEAGPAFVGLVNPPVGTTPAPSASAASCDCGCNDFDFYFFAGLTGGGTVLDGAFAGTKFHNVNAYQGQGMLGSWIVKPHTIVTWDIHDNGSLEFPGGQIVTGIGGRGTLVVTPEPASYVLAAFGLAATCIAARGGRRRELHN